MSETFEPELVQGLIGQGHGRVRTPDQVAHEIDTLAEQICARHEIFQSSTAGSQVPREQRPQYWASEYFTHWGSGWFENEAFLLRGYTYDEGCHCGAFDAPLDPAITLPGSRRDLGARGLELETRVRLLLCSCSEGEADLAGGELLTLPANFIYKPTGFAVEWYKHPRRGSNCSAEIDTLAIRSMFSDCLDSLVSPYEHICADIDAWPTNRKRREMLDAQMQRLVDLGRDGIQEALVVSDARWF